MHGFGRETIRIEYVHMFTAPDNFDRGNEHRSAPGERRIVRPTFARTFEGSVVGYIRHIKTGIGTHGLYPSRDGAKLYVANRGVARVYGPPKGKGSVSVIDFATRKVEATWPIPGGGNIPSIKDVLGS